MVLLSSFWQTLKQWDQTGLFHINQVWSNSFFDAVLPWLRESAIWLPLYIFFFVLVINNFGKKGLLWIVFFLLTITVCDQLSGFIKNWIQRPRPCNDPFMAQYIKMRLEYCSGGFSFTSSHAANHFGLSMFIHTTLKNVKGIRTAWLFIWAFIICYAQMYVGVHYPIDILGGTIVGLVAGFTLAKTFNYKYALQFPSLTPA